MKYYLLFVLFAILFVNVSDAKELKIKASLFSGTWFSTSNKYYIVDANNEEFEEIIKDCPDCIAKYNSYNKKQSQAFVLGLVGGVTIVGSLVVNGMERMQHGGNHDGYGSLLLFLGGTTLVISSFFVQSSALTDIEEIAPIYNKTQSNSSIFREKTLNYIRMFGENQYKVSFSFSL